MTDKDSPATAPTSPPTPPTSAGPRSAPPREGRLLIAALLLANVAGTAWLAIESRAMQRTQEDAGSRLTEVEHTVRQMMYEATDAAEGLGFNALLGHLQFWAPWLLQSKAGTSDRFFVDERITRIVEAMSFLPDAYPQIEQAFLTEDRQGGDSAVSDEVRKWLLQAAVAAAPEKGEELVAQVLEGETPCSLRLRRIASSQLLEIDKKRCGEILHELLSTTHGSRGGAGSPARLKQDQVFHYVEDYVATGHPEVEKTLFRILMKTEYHSEITIQTCVVELGRMKSKMAVNRIEKLYFQQVPVPGQRANPVFRRKCVKAMVEILGEDAVPFLKKVDRRESDPGLRDLLNEYKKQFDFSK